MGIDLALAVTQAIGKEFELAAQGGLVLRWQYQMKLAGHFVRRQRLQVEVQGVALAQSAGLGQVLLGFLGQGMGSCIASLEMAPRITLARMCRQYFRVSRPEPELIREFHDAVGKHLCVYDQSGTVTDKKIFSVIRYAAEELELKHFVLDSLMKCGIAEDDYTGQKMFVDRLCAEAKDTGMHIHLVAHSKKQKDELVPPGKMDVKGAGSMTDQVDNVITWWRNKKKEQADCPDQSEPDAMLICDKQRNGEWEGRAAFWFDRVSQNFVENRNDF